MQAATCRPGHEGVHVAVGSAIGLGQQYRQHQHRAQHTPTRRWRRQAPQQPGQQPVRQAHRQPCRPVVLPMVAGALPYLSRLTKQAHQLGRRQWLAGKRNIAQLRQLHGGQQRQQRPDQPAAAQQGQAQGKQQQYRNITQLQFRLVGRNKLLVNDIIQQQQGGTDQHRNCPQPAWGKGESQTILHLADPDLHKRRSD